MNSNYLKISAVILAGERDFGRCPLASRLPTALWPVAEHKAIERLLLHLAESGVKDVVICSSGQNISIADSISPDERLNIRFMDEPLPVGTAGCIRDATAEQTYGLLIVFPGSIVNPPPIDILIDAHYKGKSDLTVFFNPPDDDTTEAEQTSGIYVCSPKIIEYIPKGGYCDIKESLISEMLKSGKLVHAAVLPKNAGNFRNRHQYLHAISDYLRYNDHRNIQNCNISPKAKIIGPVLIMDGAHILDGATIIGPAVISSNVSVGQDSVVINSVLWDNVQTGPNCKIQQSVIDYNVILPNQSTVNNKGILLQQTTFLDKLTSLPKSLIKYVIAILSKSFHTILPQIRIDKSALLALLPVCLVLFAFLWSYLPNIKHLWIMWLQNDEYSSGLLVPFIAVYILWLRRNELSRSPAKPAYFIGTIILVTAILLRLFGQLFVYDSAENLSVVLCIAALVLLLFGWQMLKKTATILLFLLLMLPWPNRIQSAIALPLQNWATSSAVFWLELCGFTVIQDGNVIHIGDVTVAVAEACNGLRMITAFFVISGLVALLSRRMWWEKLIVLISSLPIALLCNTIRLSITAMLFTILKGPYWEKLFHDFGGYAMMPLALVIVVAELHLITKLTTPPQQKKEIVITRGI
jgi:exosortase